MSKQTTNIECYTTHDEIYTNSKESYTAEWEISHIKPLTLRMRVLPSTIIIHICKENYIT